ncbi:MAG: hypothetical protein FWD68_00025 [Alphaproteobacteria bacterium]|nr:hypothetical protein [Alphaproteobacteria bacterium]
MVEKAARARVFQQDTGKQIRAMIRFRLDFPISAPASINICSDVSCGINICSDVNCGTGFSMHHGNSDCDFVALVARRDTFSVAGNLPV